MYYFLCHPWVIQSNIYFASEGKLINVSCIKMIKIQPYMLPKSANCITDSIFFDDSSQETIFRFAVKLVSCQYPDSSEEYDASFEKGPRQLRLFHIWSKS